MLILIRGIACLYCINILLHVSTLRPRQNGRLFPDDIFKCIFFNKNVWISINISLKFVPRGPINNIPTLVQVMAWRRPGDKPLFEPMMVRLPTHICVTRPQWVKWPRKGRRDMWRFYHHVRQNETNADDWPILQGGHRNFIKTTIEIQWVNLR